MEWYKIVTSTVMMMMIMMMRLLRLVWSGLRQLAESAAQDRGRVFGGLVARSCCKTPAVLSLNHTQHNNSCSSYVCPFITPARLSRRWLFGCLQPFRHRQLPPLNGPTLRADAQLYPVCTATAAAAAAAADGGSFLFSSYKSSHLPFSPRYDDELLISSRILGHPVCVAYTLAAEDSDPFDSTL